MLERDWISISKDNENGNTQLEESYRNHFLHNFHMEIGKGTCWMYDTNNRKCFELRANCTKFNDIFENLKNMHKSGSNNFNILSTTSQQNKFTNDGKSFSHQKEWLACPEGPKWVPTPESLSESKHKQMDENIRVRCGFCPQPQ